tara:strand:- start:1351 stop:3225 length:1875 start_codon:yes stop_codon:yes gene_type:complete
MIEQKLIKLGSQVSRASVFLSRDFSQSISIERNLEKKSLDIKRKLVEDRGRTLASIASRGRGKQTGGGIGAALGLLGIGGGGGLLRRGLKRTPKSPNQLLRMQKGTSNLSRVGRLGKLARPLAVVGTGLDFIGRRAEGQSNVQAGVGAAGGLAGAIGGAKIGAAIGTAILPGAGTAIGGIGGSIIGSLSGGRIADLFTGANRRRQFEEDRVVLRNQKTQFSEALDDFDNALDKFEDVIGGLAIRRVGDDDDGVFGRRKRPIGFPKPPTPLTIAKKIKKFADRPSVQVTGVSAIIALLATVAVVTRGKTATKSQTIIQELLKKTPALKNFTQKEQIVGLGKILERTLSKSDIQKIRMSTSPFLTKKGTVVPGQKGAPGKFIKKRNIVKERRIQKELQKKLDKEVDKQFSKAPEFGQEKFLKENFLRDPFRLIKKNRDGFTQNARDIEILESRGSITYQQAQEAYNVLKANKAIRNEQILQYAKAIKKFIKENPNYDIDNMIDRTNLNRMLNKLDLFDPTKKIIKFDSDALKIKNLPEKLKDILKRRPVRNFLEGNDDLLSSNDLSGNGTNIALAPVGNIFLINQQQGDNNINVTEDRGNLAMTRGNVDPYSTMTTLAMFDASLTT